MIDPISAFAMLTSAHSALKKCVSMGKDLSSATNAIASYAKAEAELGFAKEQKKKGIFGSVMDQAIEQHFKEEEQNRLKDELRSLFLLYGSSRTMGKASGDYCSGKSRTPKAIAGKTKNTRPQYTDSCLHCFGNSRHRKYNFICQLFEIWHSILALRQAE